MIFFDTNILIYFSINQDFDKQAIADKIILQAIENNELIISPLVLSEYIFVLSKLNQISFQKNNIQFFQNFSNYQIDTTMVQKSFDICFQNNFCKNINDIIHLKFAEKYCSKIYTFDKNFEILRSYSKIKIEILN